MPNLIKNLINLNQSDEYPLHMPGHKRNMPGDYLENAFKVDITEIEGYDNLYEANGMLKMAKERAAEVFGAEDTYFLVNGSTVGILTAISAVTKKRGHILMARNCHKSVYHAVELQELKVSYLYPDILNDWQIATATNCEKLAYKLQQNKEISAVIITSPTYEGMASDIEKIAKTVHAYKIPLIVDEAHGSHFSFHPRFPKSAVRSGADIVVQSLHKTLPCFTQTALLHVNGSMVRREQIEKYLSFFQTSSPSYLFMAGIDNCISLLADKGASLWDNFFVYRDAFMKEMNCLQHIRVLDGMEGLDLCKLVISVQNTNMTGSQLQMRLLEEFHIQIEMAAEDYIIGIVTQSDTEEGFIRLAKALKAIDADIKPMKSRSSNFAHQEPSVKYTIAQATNMPYEEIDFYKAQNRIAAGYINLYPPGIPLVAPGEVISGELIDRLHQYEKENLHIQGLIKKQEMKQIRVIVENVK